jgi:predicted anti-sigma-YlaC factor YlaD
VERRLTCDEAARIAEALIGGEVNRERERALRAHMASCSVCNEAYAFDLALVRGMRSIPEAAFVSVSGAVIEQMAARRRRTLVLRWGAVVAAVTGVIVALDAFGIGVFEYIVRLISGFGSSSPVVVAGSKGLLILKSLADVFGGTVLESFMGESFAVYRVQGAAILAGLFAFILVLIYAMSLWLRQPKGVRS